MSWKIDRGLFKYDFIDYHAVLCVPVDADVKDIRKRYLKIARRLHPDSNATASAAEKQLATELLSKWVNPAYEKLSADRTRAEYMVVLSQMGKRLVQESSSVELNTDLARQLACVPNVDLAYKSAILKIAETQYDSLEKVLQIVAHISELNLVYLMRTAGKSFAATSQQAAPSKIDTSVSTQNKATNTPPPAPVAPPKEDSVAIQYLRRAQELLGKNQLAQARVELQDAIKLEPNNSRCHSLIGVVYLKQNQSTMAKVHFDRALQLDPNDEMALKGKRVLEQALGQKPGGSKVTSSSNNGGKQSEKSGNGGLFGGLFGGKKK
ncbi:DnaJ domain-containing protein [Plectonema radiosum NIES-515]|uniref:DnaJ domain-containing protein n=1 Tax=Plectonema radiosum NIES-515 TaxID=2986073 RepID=A0ABT3ASY2_9CYAN|nr:DnaJ domain-containing protein [Plectonema radiosum]MCV3212232.1 DnaJ domain-containing protein [Plectonema radiosum NIES-515]